MKKAILSILFLLPLFVTGLVAAPAHAALPTVSLNVSSTAPLSGDSVRFYGKVGVAKVRNAEVRLQRRNADGTWSLVRRLPVSSAAYSTWLVPPAGSSTYRIAANAASNGRLVTSRTVTVKVIPPAPNTGPTIEAVRTEILNDTNAYRAQHGLPPLKLHPDMNVVAQNWTENMAARNQLSHNPSYSSQIPAGWMTAGENIAAGQNWTEVTTAWYNSTGHRANLLDDTYTHIGIGYATNASGHPYYTQNFAMYR